ncbi:MAG: hypothetical protein F4Y24_12900 [Gemmatimonadetes bacterium]|nr:hypothetical protein [Gemmatimonadota bacterium]MYG23037.1 hypothetical protein [Gemmatimonadota bacterium]MYJ38321.1 hypothetical protein [Gemmatimonadota bacterium]
MTDPYTEATRNERRGIPTFVKVILVTGGLFAAAFVTLAVVGIIYARKMADEWVDYSETMFEDLELDATTAEAVANMAEAFIGDEVQITQADFDGSALTLRHSGQGGDFHIDLSDLEDWASEMETFLEREIENGVVIEGAGDESGGWLRVSGRNGRNILEMRGDEDGGTLRIRGPRTDTRLGLGDDATRIPSWVPIPPDASVRKHLFSGDTDEATFGGVALKVDADGRSVYDWYTDNLPNAGFGVSRSQMHWDDRRKRGKIFARTDGLTQDRELFVLVGDSGERGSSVVLMHKVER